MAPREMMRFEAAAFMLLGAGGSGDGDEVGEGGEGKWGREGRRAGARGSLGALVPIRSATWQCLLSIRQAPSFSSLRASPSLDETIPTLRCVEM